MTQAEILERNKSELFGLLVIKKEIGSVNSQYLSMRVGQLRSLVGQSEYNIVEQEVKNI